MQVLNVIHMCIYIIHNNEKKYSKSITEMHCLIKRKTPAMPFKLST